MNKEEKKLKKQQRFRKHKAKRNSKYFEKIKQASRIDCKIPLSAVTKYGVTGSWRDENSPTGYSQVCAYQGICQSPCNGDC